MKKLLFVTAVCLLSVFCLNTDIEAKKKGQVVTASDFADSTMGLGYTNPLFGWLRTNNKDQITGVSGINWLLGYSSKHFFSPMRKNSFNTYWHWGTWLIVLPYVGIGGEYIWESGFHVGVSTIYIIPTLYLGFYF